MSRGVDWLVDSSIYPIILVVSVEIFRGSRKARLKRFKEEEFSSINIEFEIVFDFDIRVIENFTTVVEFELPREACNGLEVWIHRRIYIPGGSFQRNGRNFYFFKTT